MVTVTATMCSTSDTQHVHSGMLSVCSAAHGSCCCRHTYYASLRLERFGSNMSRPVLEKVQLENQPKRHMCRAQACSWDDCMSCVGQKVS